MKLCYLNFEENKKYNLKLEKLVSGLTCVATGEELLKNNFTNIQKSTYYLCESIQGKNNYPVTLNISISTETMKIQEIFICDENFLQPHFVNEEYYKKIEKIINELISNNIFKK